MDAQDAPDPETMPNALDDRGRKTGPWAERDAHGGFMTGEYVEGVREGVWRHFADDGRLRSVGPFEAGAVHGHWNWWRANGERLQSGGFDREEKHGLWERWTAEGVLIDRGEYDHGKKVGEWTVYNPDGSVEKTTKHRHRRA
ncbi:toxin-antitoxin system YwqK family antitoxin [Glycomyces harbinensis]|uniref:MORN repeat variant n=1 Tax=Glycomyces harbinensis TaxID=58114 RepID=A0A1G6U646_9ACTN|nr:hypothetical protein [Glycomyces harbinensis]SDD36684.1 MORN repeat variant [Glycomyces harbinensis]